MTTYPIMNSIKQVTPSQWVQVGGGTLTTQDATSLGEEVACETAKWFCQSYCQDIIALNKKWAGKTEKGGFGFSQVA